MKVRATQRGYFGGKIREVGDEFSITEKKQLGKWMQLLDAPKESKKEEKPKAEDKPKAEEKKSAKGESDVEGEIM